MHTATSWETYMVDIAILNDWTEDEFLDWLKTYMVDVGL